MTEILAYELFAVFEWYEPAYYALTVRLSGYQPQYFPRLHYFARALDSDIFTISDYLQYVRKHAFVRPDGTRQNGVSYQAHTPIKTRQGILELGIPVKRAFLQTIREAEIDYATPWHEKHLNVIAQEYRRALHFESVFSEITALLSARHGTLGALTNASIVWGFARLLGLERPHERTAAEIDAALTTNPVRLKRLVFLSGTDVEPPCKEEGRDATAWLIAQCEHFGATEYHFGGTSACAYMDFARFRARGINLVQQSWTCAEYPQLHGPFIPNLSIIDLLMHVPHDATQILHPVSSRHLAERSVTV